MNVHSVPKLQLKSLTKQFHGQTVVDIAGLEVYPGRCLALLGPSGCGKSTLLRLIAGIERPSSGTVSVDGVDITCTPPERRHIGLVFQDHALFPHLNVADNLSYGLVEQGLPRPERQHLVAYMLELMQLSELQRRTVQELSGGERQRVALARALLPKPHILLLDEPFASLDEQLRQELRQELRQLFQELGQTTVLVTHDQRDAFNLADTVAVIHNGRIEHMANPSMVFYQPRTRWLAEFLGHKNILTPQQAEQLQLQCSPERWLLLPEAALQLHEQQPTDGIYWPAQAVGFQFAGQHQYVQLEVLGLRLSAHISALVTLPRFCWLSVLLQHIHELEQY
jgi:ABC-type Fe3+/spermidine/putrescine transport system ATPase subunit